MKVFKGDSVIEVILLVIVNIVGVILFLSLKVEIVTILLCMLMINLLGYYFVSVGMNFFEVNSSKLIVKNSWRPWFEDQYKLEEIETLEINDVVNIGQVLIIKFKNAKSKTWSCNLAKDSLEDLVNYVLSIKNDQ